MVSTGSKMKVRVWVMAVASTELSSAALNRSSAPLLLLLLPPSVPMLALPVWLLSAAACSRGWGLGAGKVLLLCTGVQVRLGQGTGAKVEAEQHWAWNWQARDAGIRAEDMCNVWEVRGSQH